ncbi:MAG: carbohydrate ABC transporter permease [Chloroflexi bacterium]|nr:carbohydrate ABC transporter permease [Chloroflexota bacterium]
MATATTALRTAPQPGVRWNRILGRTAVYVIAILCVFLTLIPILWLILTSFRPQIELSSPRLMLLPHDPTLQNYVDVFTRYKTTDYLRNSIIVSLGVVITNLIIGPPAAYALARFRFPGDQLVLAMIIVFRMIPIVTAMIPLFIVFTVLGLINTYAGLIVAHTAFKLPVTIWVLRGFFIDVPKELDDSARVDGCSTFGTFWRIALPLVKPGLAAAGVLAFLWTWNDLIVTLILSTGDATVMLPLGLTKFVLEYGVDWGPMTAAGVIVFLPTLVFIFVAERYLVGGLTLGGVKE